MDNNKEVLIKSLPKAWSEEDVKNFVSEKVGMTKEAIFAANVCLS